MVQKSERINRDWVLDQMVYVLERGWCQGYDAITASGATCCFWDKRATSYSITGALHLIFSKQPKARRFEWEVTRALTDAMATLRKIHNPTVDGFNFWAESYNDAPARTKNEIIAWVKKAKEMPCQG